MGIPVATIDRIDNLTMTERHGVIRALTRKARVLIQPADNPKDYSALKLAMEAIDSSGYSPFSSLSPINFPKSYSALRLIERSPSIAEGDPGCVDIILKYEHILDGPNQAFFGLGAPGLIDPKVIPTLYGKGRSSIAEKSTNFFYPNGDAKGGPSTKRLILVGHVFPKTDTGAMAQTLANWSTSYGTYAAVQGGEVTIPFPQSNFSITGIAVAVGDPWSLSEKIHAKINLNPWLHKPAFTWICSEVSFDCVEPATGTYRFSFEFQYNIDTWNPRVVFNDQRTGRPPASVMPGTRIDPNFPATVPRILSYQNNINGGRLPAGYWDVTALAPVDFDAFFGQLLEGGGAPIIV